MSIINELTSVHVGAKVLEWSSRKICCNSTSIFQSLKGRQRKILVGLLSWNSSHHQWTNCCFPCLWLTRKPTRPFSFSILAVERSMSQVRRKQCALHLFYLLHSSWLFLMTQFSLVSPRGWRWCIWGSFYFRRYTFGWQWFWQGWVTHFSYNFHVFLYLQKMTFLLYYFQRIVGWLAESFKRDEGVNLLKDKQALQRLTETAEKAKIELSSLTQTNIRYDNTIFSFTFWLIDQFIYCFWLYLLFQFTIYHCNQRRPKTYWYYTYQG